MLLSRMVDCSIVCRQFLPLLVGLCIGISVSLINSSSIPWVKNICRETSPALQSDFVEENVVDSFHIEESNKNSLENEEDTSDYEPRINLAGKPHLAKKEPQVLIRPRYFSTELGIKDRSFVAVLSSIRQISSLGLAMNETLSHYVSRLAFFVEVSHNDKLDVKTLPIVGFKDSQQGLLTMHTLKYLADKLAQGYNYFFLVKDTTFVDGRKLDSLVKHISISENVYMGSVGSDPTSNPTVCSLDSGILISSSVLQAVSPLLEACNEEFAFNSDDEKVGLCINRATNLTCLSQFQSQTFTTFNLDTQINDVRQLEKAWNTLPDLPSALTFYHARDPSYFFMLNKLSCSTALQDVNYSIRELEQSILRLAPRAPGGLDSVTWPIGYSPSSKPETRFSVPRWDYFNTTHIFFDTEHSVAKPLSGVNLEDIEELINAAVAYMLKENPDLEYSRLLDGYKRFDPVRGMDYIINLRFLHPTEGEIIQRMEGCRPITHVDTVPMPYVTESSLVHIVVVIWEDEQLEAAEKFTNQFAKNWLAKSDKSELTLIIPNRDGYGSLKKLAHSLNNQYKKQGSTINLVSFKGGPTRSGLDFVAADLVSSKLGPDSLIFLCDPFTEIYPDVLNRVRINTISGWQLYSPIPFAEYNPEVFSPNMPRSEILNISTNQGFYDPHNIWHISFYVADYLNARKTFEMDQPLIKSERYQGDLNYPYESILAMFVRLRQLHVLRAVEPHLRLRYHFQHCLTSRCQESFLSSQGTRSQLAQFALDTESARKTK